MLYESDYVKIVQELLGQRERQTRNAKTRAMFGKTLEINELVVGRFPVLHGRKLFLSGVIGEMAAFLKGPKSVQDFEDQGCNYWKLWGEDDGSLVVDYGNKWLDFNGYNQLQATVDGLKSDPFGRRHLISSWDPAALESLSLPCCHYAYQWFVTDGGVLEMLWHQRSADWMIGTPSDVILAAIFNILMAQTVGLVPGKITMTFGDCHIYSSHIEGVSQYLGRTVDFQHNLEDSPVTYTLAPEATLFNFEPWMLTIQNYLPLSRIEFKLEA